jgi:predicted metal-binding membrane protein
MNMFRIAGVALLVVIENLFPFGRRVSQLTRGAPA